MNPELMELADECDNPLEFFIAALLYYLVEMIFRIVEVVVDFGEV